MDDLTLEPGALLSLLSPLARPSASIPSIVNSMSLTVKLLPPSISALVFQQSWVSHNHSESLLEENYL